MRPGPVCAALVLGAYAGALTTTVVLEWWLG